MKSSTSGRSLNMAGHKLPSSTLAPALGTYRSPAREKLADHNILRAQIEQRMAEHREKVARRSRWS